jgi:SAM-dependent methyltransferase
VNFSAAALDRHREKWREAPRGSDTDGRVFSSDLLALSDDAFLATWDGMAARRYTGEIGWLGAVYGDTFRGRRILELGSGLGFDGIRFAQLGAVWTFADIVPDNLAVIRRVADLKGLSSVTFHLIGDDLSFAALPADFDAIWVFGSIHHVPFEIARQEALAALEHLRPGGRWMELVYPRERWLREGALPFSDWGRGTDGERTPWVEWHDIEKVRRRLFPAPLRTLLDFELCSSNYRAGSTYSMSAISRFGLPISTWRRCRVRAAC